ncbi:E4 [Tursiops truncatus papillomavirus 7]|uniref:E4 n=1 Tax=Tursiops truncatus papillomavirus 7 TaxID=1144383 RepID=H6UYQ6_9PAPI|nr:E4 [Tursiops truncatus papillomavirus 7]
MIVHLYLALPHLRAPWDTPLYQLLQDSRADKERLKENDLDLPLHHPHHHHQHHLPHHGLPPHQYHPHDQNVTKKPAQQEQPKEKPLQEVVIPVEEPVTVTVTVALPNGSELSLAFLVS